MKTTYTFIRDLMSLLKRGNWQQDLYNRNNQINQELEILPEQCNQEIRRMKIRWKELGSKGRTIPSQEKQAELCLKKLARYTELEQKLLLDDKSILLADDAVAITADISQFSKVSQIFGQEIEGPKVMSLVEEERKIIVTSKQFHNKTIADSYNAVKSIGSGVFFSNILRSGEILKPQHDLQLKNGDEVRLIGKTADLNKVSSILGYTISENKTDFIFFGLGMSLGYIIGMISFNIFDVSIALGNGVGCLISGLIFGWIRSNYPRYANLPTGASNFLKDFGLAVFVSTIAITAGPNAVTAIKNHGLDLFLLGIAVTIVPQIITFFISYYILKIKNPIDLLATIAGGRSANPGFAAILEKAGNSTPVVPFTAAYALANIWLTLWGPVIVSLVTKNPT